MGCFRSTSWGTHRSPYRGDRWSASLCGGYYRCGGRRGYGRGNSERKVHSLHRREVIQDCGTSYKPKRSRPTSLLSKPLRLRRGPDCSSCHFGSMVQSEEFRVRLFEGMGKLCSEGVQRNVSRGTQETAPLGYTKGWSRKKESAIQFEGFPKDYKPTKAKEAKGWRTTCRWRWHDWSRPEEEAEGSERQAYNWQESSRVRSGGLGRRERGVRGERRFTLCTGTGPHHRVPSGPMAFSARPGGCVGAGSEEKKRGPLSGGKRGEGLGKGERCQEEEDEEEEDGREVVSLAGSCRATGETQESEEGEREEERKRKAFARGKGVGETTGRHQQEEEQERRSLRSFRERDFVGGVWGRGRGKPNGVRHEGPFASESREETRICDENAGQALSRSFGPILSVDDGGENSSDLRCETGHLLQPSCETQLSEHQQRHEGAVSASSGAGLPSQWETSAGGRHFVVQVPGGALRGKRRKLVSRQVPGDVPIGSCSVSPNGCIAEGSKTPAACSEKPRVGKRRLVKPLPPRGWMERWRSRRRERERQGQVQRRKRKRKRKSTTMAKGQLAAMAVKRGSVVEEAEGAKGAKREGREGEGKGGQVSPEELFGYERGEEAPTLGKDYELFGWLLEAGSSMRSLGCLLAWSVIHATCAAVGDGRITALRSVLAGKHAMDLAMRRLRCKEAFPIRIGGLAGVIRALRRVSLEEAGSTSFGREWSEECWLFCCIEYSNYLHGCRSSPTGCWRNSDLAAVGCLRRAVARTLAQDVHLPRSVGEVEKELSHRFVSYSGDEIPKMEVLTLEQVVPALPPKGHGGCICVASLVKGRTRSFLLHPDDCIVEDIGQSLPKLQAKCHILESDRLSLAKTLVESGVCFWTEESEVFQYRQQKVLNGLFGVAKSTQLPNGKPLLRCIMNLVPSNSTMRQLDGCVRELPSISQYLSITLGPGESLAMFQSDMVAAFYLFRLPPCWRKYLCFNLAFDGNDIGLKPGVMFYLSCGVLPMGWTSAVSVMQELSQELLLQGGLSEEKRISRLKPLPSWLCAALSSAREKGSAWWHIYLDNFFAGERTDENLKGCCAAALHSAAEEAWLDAGVISSEKKRASHLAVADELGARLDGDQQTLGVSGERLVKVIQSTLLLLSRRALPKKWLQVITGRWIHIFQFKRAGMSTMHLIWKWIAGKSLGGLGVLRAREELLMCCLGSCLFHTHLGADISKLTSASDASSRGGAVGHASTLGPAGCDFVRSLSALTREPLIKTRCLVISLFNGIGGAFRCYDILGCEVEALIGFEIAAGPNRVCSRRWPHAVLKGDVKELDVDFIRELYFRYPHALCIHLWAGFPCVDLSAVKHNRRNLGGTQSGLFFEILRVLDLLRSIFGVHFPIFFFVENVASMDRKAAEEISSHLGVIPFRVQCADVISVSRPRYCWTNVEIAELQGIQIISKGYYKEVVTTAPWVPLEAWIREGSEVSSQDVIFPTCMKSIVRRQPPPAPAGISRCDSATISRWRADEYRFPPYRYKPQYVLWDDNTWRLIDAQERDISHGYGWDHTALCMSASDIKQSYTKYEDLRKSLVGDCFSVLSFVIFPWAALKDVMPAISYAHLLSRMGMAPGFASPLSLSCPISRKLLYGSLRDWGPTVEDLTRQLLTRVNHTGSDVRVTTGGIMAPKAFPRQSASQEWWQWRNSFSCKWKRKDHINSLELRAILLSYQWRVLRHKECDIRFVHLTDSYVCMSVLSKGRSSSNMLMHLVRKCAAFCFSYGLLPILIHVESTENPTDEASRQ